jgi:hypothetical protein
MRDRGPPAPMAVAEGLARRSCEGSDLTHWNVNKSEVRLRRDGNGHPGLSSKANLPRGGFNPPTQGVRLVNRPPGQPPVNDNY